MKLYTNDKGQWAGTQADANKQLGRGFWHTVEVPVDKTCLMAFLNNRKVGAIEVQSEPKPSVEPTSELLSPQAASWVAWSLDTLKRGDTKEAEAMLMKGLTIQKSLIGDNK